MRARNVALLRCCLIDLAACSLIISITAAHKVGLPLGDINVVVVTDVHSWVAGHGAHEALDADYGDVVSFYERLSSSSSNRDVWFIMNGDFIDGTGLSAYPPIHLEKILVQMSWHALNVGNHDIYKNETVEFITRPGGLVQHFGSAYLTSNVVNATTGKPIGSTHTYLRGNHSTVLVFGFMYNIDEGIGSPLARVERVEEVVEREWFQKVLRADDFDAIMVLAHMSADDPSVQVILRAIRKETTSMPVQFITGHTHHRRYDVLDEWSTALEAGCYLDTIGFVSFPNKQTMATANSASNSFQHVFLDAKVEILAQRLGVNKLKTKNGQAMTDFIHQTQDEMGLRKIVGCSPRTYSMNRTLVDEDSLFGLWAKQVIPTQFRPKNAIVLQGKSSSFRYDLFEGNVRLDDLIIVSPFNDTMYLVASNLSAHTIIALNETMNRQRNMDLPGLPDFILIGTLKSSTHDLYTLEYEVPFLKQALENLIDTPIEPKPVEAAATSLWLSFIKEFWPTCPPGDKTAKAVRMQTKQVDMSSPVLPGTLSTTVSATVAFILLLMFLRRRKHRRRHGD